MVMHNKALICAVISTNKQPYQVKSSQVCFIVNSAHVQHIHTEN